MLPEGDLSDILMNCIMAGNSNLSLTLNHKSSYLLTVSTMRTVSSRFARPFSRMSLLVLGSSIRLGSRIITCFFCWLAVVGPEELLAELTFLRLDVEGRMAVELMPPGVGDRGETLRRKNI